MRYKMLAKSVLWTRLGGREMIGYIKALENIADAIWYLNQVVDITDDDCQKVLQGLQEASDTLTDSRNELCGWCGAYKAADIGACDHCRWR